VEEAADGEGVARGGGAPGQEVRRGWQQAAALRQPRLVGGERTAEAARRGGERQEVAGTEVRRDERQHVLRQREDEVGAVPAGGGEHRGDRGGRGRGRGRGSCSARSDFLFLARPPRYFLSPRRLVVVVVAVVVWDPLLKLIN